MMVRRRTVPRMMISVLATALLATGCGGGTSTSGETGNEASDGTPKRGGTLIFSLNTDVRSLDPVLCGITGWERCQPIYGTLLNYNHEKQQFEPGMAESFESSDGKEWTLKLRPGVKFTDGTPFDAEAVAFNWERISDPKNLSPARDLTTDLEWEVVDPLTLKVTSKKPNYQLPWALQQGLGMIASPTAIKSKGADFGNQPVGAGPFILKEWTRNTQLVYERNPNYWDQPRPYADRYIIKIIPADDQRLNALRTGEINMMWTLVTSYVKKAEQEGFVKHELPLIGGTGLQFNLRNEHLKDPNLRLAILKLLNPEQINAAVYPGDTAPDAFFYPGSPYRDDSLGKFPERDVPGAQKLVDEYLAKIGQPSLTLKFTTYAGIPLLEQVAQLMQAQIQEAKGLKVELVPVDGVTLSRDVAARNYELVMGASLSQHADGIYKFFHSKGSQNTTGYSNPVVDEALEKTRSSNDPEVVKRAYQVVNGEISKDGVLRTWRYQSGRIMTPKYIKGIQMAYMAATPIETVWIDK